jgi:hypothetical protein
MIKRLINEVERVVILRERYRALGESSKWTHPSVNLMTHSIEMAKILAETGDVGQIMLAIKSLEGWAE